jgi:hypothetical protein
MVIHKRKTVEGIEFILSSVGARSFHTHACLVR